MGMNAPLLTVFLLTSIVLALTPGPDMLLSVSRSVTQGRKAGIISGLGSACGVYVHATAAALGLSSLLTYAPVAYDVLRYFGAGYLLYLAWQVSRSGSGFPIKGSSASSASLTAVFRHAVLINLMNPKAILFFVAFFPQFIHPGHVPMLAQAIVLTTVMNLFALGVLAALALSAGSISTWLARRPYAARFQGWLLGTVFGVLAVRLVLADRQGP